jgi:chromosome partitioning protein
MRGLAKLFPGRPADNQASQLASKISMRPSHGIAERPAAAAHPAAPPVLARLAVRPDGEPIVISIVGKGGSSKTTTGINLATIGRYLNHRPLILDIDPQASASAWRHCRGHDDVKVFRCRSEQFGDALARAKAQGLDLVVVDNPPAMHEFSVVIAKRADLVLLTTAASPFDLLVTLKWVAWLDKLGARYCIVLGNAPPSRGGEDSPLIRDARRTLTTRGASDEPPLKNAPPLWRGQLTRRHAVIYSTAGGLATMEYEPDGPAALEFNRLWAAISGIIIRDGRHG